MSEAVARAGTAGILPAVSPASRRPGTVAAWTPPRQPPGRRRYSLWFIWALTAVACAAGEAILPPAQPDTGPGGKDYTHASATCQTYGSGNEQYWIFEPAEPKPERAPVVFFLHGWTAMEPAAYGGWIRHLARKGSIVIYPRYQANLLTPPAVMLESAIGALKAALKKLAEPGHVQPDLTKVALAGHSLGGAMCVNVAARAKAEGLPQPKAVMIVQPPGAKANGITLLPAEDPAKIPAGTLLLVVVGEHDIFVWTDPGRQIFEQATSLPRADRNYVLMKTDLHGQPPLWADHFSPMAFDGTITRATGAAALAAPKGVNSATDALDYYGYWKFGDALCDAAFTGKNREHALGNTPQQKYMGKWSDGVPVREPQVVVPEEAGKEK